MIVPGLQAWRTKFLECFAVVQQINRVRFGGEMPAFHDDIPRSHPMDRLRGAAHLFERRDLESAQRARFVQIRCDDSGER